MTAIDIIKVIPQYHEFEFTFNDFKNIGTFKAARIFAYPILESLIGGYDTKKNNLPLLDIKYKNFDRLVCLVSDTHDDEESLVALLKFCNRYQISLMIHTGDLIDPVLMLDRINAMYKGRCIVTMGNHDRRKRKNYRLYFKHNNKRIMVCPYEAHVKLLEDGRITFSGNVHNDLGFLNEKSPHLYLRAYHGDDFGNVKNIIYKHENYDVFICGHTHEDDYKLINMYAETKRTKIILNPGTFSINRLPPDKKIGFMILGINNLQVTDIMKININTFYANKHIVQ